MPGIRSRLFLFFGAVVKGGMKAPVPNEGLEEGGRGGMREGGGGRESLPLPAIMKVFAVFMSFYMC